MSSEPLFGPGLGYAKSELCIVNTGQAYFQPGKDHTLTLFATNPAETNQLESWVADALGPLRDSVELVYSIFCLNILPRGIDKGKGLTFLAEVTDYVTEEMLGVGDSNVDPPFLLLIGYSAAPANAIQTVKDMVHYVAPRPTSDGVRDILNHFGIV